MAQSEATAVFVHCAISNKAREDRERGKYLPRRRKLVYHGMVPLPFERIYQGN